MGCSLQHESLNPMNVLVKYILLAAFIFCVWSVFMSFFVYYTYTHPPRHVSNAIPSDYGMSYKRVTFSNDIIELAGWLISSPKDNVPTIIACHGYPFDKGNILDLVSFLYPDYNIFLFDFRAMGESKGDVSTLGFYEVDDLRAAASYLKSIGVKKMGAIGFSLGAAVIIMANIPDIKAIVSDSSFKDLNSVSHLVFRRLGPLKVYLTKLVNFWSRLFLKIDINKVSTLNSLQSINCPIMFIHGESDKEIPVEHSKVLYEKAKNYGKQVALWTVPGAGHGGVYFANQFEYSKRVKVFFNKHLKSGRSTMP